MSACHSVVKAMKADSQRYTKPEAISAPTAVQSLCTYCWTCPGWTFTRTWIVRLKPHKKQEQTRTWHCEYKQEATTGNNTPCI